MNVRREQVLSVLAQRVENTLNQANLWADLFQKSQDAVVLQQRRVARMKQNIELGAAFTLSDLVNSLQDQVRNDVDLVNARYDYLISLSILKRLEMSGAYSPASG